MNKIKDIKGSGLQKPSMIKDSVTVDRCAPRPKTTEADKPKVTPKDSSSKK